MRQLAVQDSSGPKELHGVQGGDLSHGDDLAGPVLDRGTASFVAAREASAFPMAMQPDQGVEGARSYLIQPCVNQVFMWMGSYGGDSGLASLKVSCRLGPKPTFLYSNYKFIESVYIPLPSNKTWSAQTSLKPLVMQHMSANSGLRYQDSSGVARVQGGPDLKGSQHYPVRFGETIMELFMANHKAVKDHVKKTTEKLEGLSCKELKDPIYN